MKKNLDGIIDLSQEGPIIDIAPGGFADFSNAFKNVLRQLSLRSPLPSSRQKVNVTVSTISYSNGIQRCEFEKIYTAGYLFRLHKKWFGYDCIDENYESSVDSSLELYEKEGERRAAWGFYSQSMYLFNLEAQEEKIKKLPEKERLKAQEQKRNGGCAIFIGG